MVPVDNLGTYLLTIVYFIDRYLVPIIFALAFIVFLWGIYSTFIAGATNEEKRQEGQKVALYGIIGFFVMISVWGILNLLIHSFGFGVSQRPNLPTFGAPSSVSSQGTNPFNTAGSGSSGGGNAGTTASVCPPGMHDYLDGNGCVSDTSAGSGAGSGSNCPIGMVDNLDGSGCVPDSSATPTCSDPTMTYNPADKACESDFTKTTQTQTI